MTRKDWDKFKLQLIINAVIDWEFLHKTGIGSCAYCANKQSNFFRRRSCCRSSLDYTNIRVGEYKTIILEDYFEPIRTLKEENYIRYCRNFQPKKVKND